MNQELIHVIVFARRNWKIILAAIVIVGMSAGLFSLLIPPVYKTEASLLPRKGLNTGTAGLLAGTGLAGALPVGLLANASPMAELQEVLESRTLTERVIARLSLGKQFRGWKTREDLVSKLKKRVKVTPPSLQKNLLVIHVSADKPELAASIANTYVDELKRYLDEVGYSSATKNRRFIKKQLEKSEEELRTAEEHLTGFQTKHGTVSLPETAKAALDSLASIEAKRIETGISLSATQETLESLEKRVQALQADPNSLLDVEIRKRSIQAQQQAIDLTRRRLTKQLASLPPRGLEFARLQRDVQVQNALYLGLTQQYEVALVAEAKDSDEFIVLDKAMAPEKPSEPNKRRNVLIGLIIGAVLGIGAALFRDLFLSRSAPSINLTEKVR